MCEHTVADMASLQAGGCILASALCIKALEGATIDLHALLWTLLLGAASDGRIYLLIVTDGTATRVHDSCGTYT